MSSNIHFIYRELKRRRLQKERARADKVRNAEIAKKAKEEAEKQWWPYAIVMKEKAYTKCAIPTHNQVKRYLIKEKNVKKQDLETISETNDLETLKKYW